MRREQISIFNLKEIVHAHAYCNQYKLPPSVGELNGASDLVHDVSFPIS